MRGFNVKKRITSIGISLIMVFATGCSMDYLYGEEVYYQGSQWDQGQSILNGTPFRENKAVYENYGDGIAHIYLTVQEGYLKESGERYSFSYLSNYTDSDVQGEDEPFCNVIMSEGSADKRSTLNGFGFGEMTANGKLTVKGSADRIQSRSWQIQLYDRAGLYNGAKTINFIKNNEDLSRVKIKLGFDLVQMIEDAGGLGAKFARLFVYDTTEKDLAKWVDLGIHTMVEQPNKTYLRAHGLDENGELYRARNFSFEDSDSLKNKDDPDYNKLAFEEILVIREGKDHKKLISMVDTLNNPNTKIDDVLGVYFNEENLCSYLAMSLMMGNVKAGFEDYLLYSPQNSQTWYFIFEDFRNAFEVSSIEGYGSLLNNKLFRLYLGEEENRMKVLAKIRELRMDFTEEYLNAKLQNYQNDILKYVYSMPEINQLPALAEEVEPYIKSLTDKIGQAENIDFSIEAPYIYGYRRIGSTVTLDFKLQKNYSYEAEIATDRRFTEIVDVILLNANEFTYNVKGGYYLRLLATSPDGSSIRCGNISVDSLGRRIYGGIEIE